jgi:hypothetical protein
MYEGPPAIHDDENEKMAFQNKLHEYSGNMNGCLYAKNYSLKSLETSVMKAESFFEQDSSEMLKIIVERDDEQPLFRFFIECMRYAATDKNNNESTFIIREHFRKRLLAFLNGARDTFAIALAQNFKGNENHITEGEIRDFCQMYFEMAANERDPSLSADSMVSFAHVTTSFLEKAKRIREPGGGDETLNYLAVLSGDEETLQLWLNEFLRCGKFSDTIFSFYEISGFFPNNGHMSYANKFLSEKLDEPSSVEKYLSDGFTKEEISRARELFRDSVGDKIMKKITEETYGLDSKKLLEAWGDGQLRESVISDLSAIRDLEKEQPGSARELFEGPEKIRCFGRYDTDFLLEQLDALSPGEPYGVECNAYEDHNGVFRNRQKIHQQIRDESNRLGMKTRLMEYSAESREKDKLLQQLAEMAPNAPGENYPLADYIWINQHGYSHENNPERMEQKRKEWEHIFGIGPNRSSLVIKSGGAVGSFMCFGGEEGNAMDTLAREYDISATGATKPPSNIYGVKFERDPSGRLFINVDYGYSAATPGETKIYEYDK